MLTLRPEQLTDSELIRVARAELLHGEPLPVAWQYALVERFDASLPTPRNATFTEHPSYPHRQYARPF